MVVSVPEHDLGCLNAVIACHRQLRRSSLGVDRGAGRSEPAEARAGRVESCGEIAAILPIAPYLAGLACH